MDAFRKHYNNVHIVFRRNVEMRWAGKDLSYDYFGEWSRTTNEPHGRGIYFGKNCLRVGYFKDGHITRGKVLTIALGEKGNEVLIGTEEELNGKTK